METVTITIEAKYDPEAGPVPGPEELTAKFNDLVSQEWVLDPTGEEKVLGFKVDVEDFLLKKERFNQEVSEFVSDIDKYVLGPKTDEQS